ncbi:MAG: TIGR03936 family radical SAM-associated protein [Candidatus Omnitrophota bacterium]
MKIPGINVTDKSRKIKYTLVFEKKKDMKYIAHLDLMNLFRRAVRRADLPFYLTEGFTPRIKISMPEALKLGVESDNETLSLWLTEGIAPEKLSDLLNEQLPRGVRILSGAVSG